jgi:chromosome segregation ATPase
LALRQGLTQQALLQLGCAATGRLRREPAQGHSRQASRRLDQGVVVGLAHLTGHGRARLLTHRPSAAAAAAEARVAALDDRVAALEDGASPDYQQLQTAAATLNTSIAAAATLAEGLRQGAEGSAATVERLRQALTEAQAGVDAVGAAAEQLTAQRQGLLAYVETLREVSNGHHDQIGRERQELRAELTAARDEIASLVGLIQSQANTVADASRITDTLARTAQAEAQAAAEKAAEQQLAVVELALAFMGVSQADLQAQMEGARMGLGQQPPELNPRFLSDVVKTRRALVAAKAQAAEKTARVAGMVGRPVTPPSL